MGHTLLKEISNELLMLQALECGDGKLINNDMMYVERELLQIARIFQAYHILKLEVYTYVDPCLAVIKCNRTALHTFVINGLSLACQNINQKFRETPSARDEVQEIFIHVQPDLTTNAIGSFLSLRRLIVSIYDSGSSTLTANSNGVLGYGHLICKRMVAHNGDGNYDIILMNHFKYITKLQFSFPYLSHPQAVNFAKLLDHKHIQKAFCPVHKVLKYTNNSMVTTIDNYYDITNHHMDQYNLNVKCNLLKERKILVITIGDDKVSHQNIVYLLERNNWNCVQLNKIKAILDFKNLNYMDTILISYNDNLSSDEEGVERGGIGDEKVSIDVIIDYITSLRAVGYEMPIFLLVNNKKYDTCLLSKFINRVFIKPFTMLMLDAINKIADAEVVRNLLWINNY